MIILEERNSKEISLNDGVNFFSYKLLSSGYNLRYYTGSMDALPYFFKDLTDVKKYVIRRNLE